MIILIILNILKNCYELLISGKNENDYYKITYQEKDIFYDKTNWKILFFPNFIDFKKDFFTSTKGIFRNLLKIILEKEFFNNEVLQTVGGLLNNLDLQEFQVLDLIKSKLKTEDINIDYYYQDNLFNYLLEQIIFNIFDIENEIIEIVDEIKIKKIYLIFLEYFSKMDDKNILCIFEEPLIGLNYCESKKILSKIKQISNKIILISIISYLEIEDIKDIKYFFNNKLLIDFSEIYDDLYNYLIYWEGKNEEDFLYNLALFIKYYFENNCHKFSFNDLTIGKNIIKINKIQSNISLTELNILAGLIIFNRNYEKIKKRLDLRLSYLVKLRSSKTLLLFY
ncbi:hypothetical protein [Spiroplasma citri]|uniref:Uncharacterized protein n=1 Tax=Spiroplasma citri TaxID=2133 RepID=A0AAJ4EK59_SPICI|nr:hypothetical protein [Spiroplasma citri]APE75164.1 hypothetical protein SCITRI_001286 [Spiroplasma citri]QIA67417.1 hypothetical protein GMI18_07100 [Spiroplasma citri]QIA69271.1 hypothetical protein GL298_07055 [Spiroplasma citri]QIA73181.1 hypothetical protein GL982_05915 [Spiroplasma citri]QJU62043.1 hypothetical protein HHA36_06625 [Spiroplasma citri]